MRKSSFSTKKTHPTFEGYDPVSICRRVAGKIFEITQNSMQISISYLSKVYNISLSISSFFEKVIKTKLTTSISLFSIPSCLGINWIFWTHKTCSLYTTHERPTLHMLSKKIFRHFDVSVQGEDSISFRPTDTINIHTLKSMKFFRRDGQCLARTKGFDLELSPLTLPFDEDDDANVTPHHIPSSSVIRPTGSFTFTKDHHNLLNGHISSLASSIDGLDGMLHQ